MEALQHSQVPSCCCCSPGVAVFTHEYHTLLSGCVISAHTSARSASGDTVGLIVALSALPDWLPARRIYGVCGLAL